MKHAITLIESKDGFVQSHYLAQKYVNQALAVSKGLPQNIIHDLFADKGYEYLKQKK